MVKGLLFRMDGSRNIDLEDLYQEVMVVVFTRIKNNELNQLTAKLSTYVYKTAQNLLLYKLRQDGRMRTSELIDNDILDEEPIDFDIDALKLMALEMVKNLTYPCNEIIEDWYLNRLDYEQIARKYKYRNANTAKKKKGDCISKARVEAKKLLTNRIDE
jgi:RNA polymerase sigma factor (sigma-70 family)